MTGEEYIPTPQDYKDAVSIFRKLELDAPTFEAEQNENVYVVGYEGEHLLFDYDNTDKDTTDRHLDEILEHSGRFHPEVAILGLSGRINYNKDEYILKIVVKGSFYGKQSKIVKSHYVLPVELIKRIEDVVLEFEGWTTDLESS